MVSKHALKFWDNPDFKRQQELIAGPVAWECSEKNAALHRNWIETQMIQDWLKLQRPEELIAIAEIGCGVGRLLKEFSKDYNCYGFDISENMLKKAKEYLEDTKRLVSLKLVNDGALPANNSTCHFVFAFLVFQHIQTKSEIEKYMQEIFRILKPEGFFRVQTLRGQPHPEESFGGFHGRFYPSLEEFSNELDGRFGLTVVEAEEGLGHPEWLWLTLRK